MPQLDAGSIDALWRLAVALAVGLVIGGEREQRKGEGPGRAAAGVRTFALVALLGGVAGLVGPTLVGALALFVGAAAVTSYALGDRSDPGLTTEVALLAAYALGALAATRPVVALAAGVSVAMLLAARTGLHGFLRRTLSERELRDALVLAVSAVVVLPLLPDRFVGPYHAVNPQLVWRLAVVMMAITAAGHVAQRALGAALGLVFAGFAGGFASSAATIAAMAARAREDDRLHAAAVAGATASTAATFVQLGVVLGMAGPAVGARVAPALAAGGAVATAYALLRAWRALRASVIVPPPGRAFSFGAALLFAALVSGVGLLSALARARFGEAAVPVAAALAGLADAHAAAASAAALHASGGIPERLAVLAVLAALTTNTLTKVGLAFGVGTRRFAGEVTLGLVLAVGAAWGVVLLRPGP